MNYTRGLETVAKGVSLFAGAYKYQCRPCECSRGHESASRAKRVLINAMRVPIEIVGEPKEAGEYTTISRPLQHSHSSEKVLLNFLLQAKRVLVDCRGLESALAVGMSVEAVRVLIEALRCFRGHERLEEVPKNVN